jgi:hypothetical protein
MLTYKLFHIFWRAGLLAAFVLGLMISACKEHPKRNKLEGLEYKSFKDSLLATSEMDLTDSINIFDFPAFVPGRDSLDTLLVLMDTLWHEDEVELLKEDMLQKDTTAKAAMQRRSLADNFALLDSFYLHRNDTAFTETCKGLSCTIYAEVIMATQTMYLYIGGELVDSFPVSTGTKGYETPEMSLRPSGPVFTKYTSRKFPGGNYKGLGNMPYAVFIRGGYAIHGTTTGNFKKLGTPASHGCIRLHPDNAIIFQALVKRAGLEETWVTIKKEAVEQ